LHHLTGVCFCLAFLTECLWALRYRARAKDCNHCPLKTQCTTNSQGRSLCRSVEETILERVRSYQDLESYKKALRKRQVWVEPLFAEGKDWHGMRRFRLRRLWRVNSETLLRAAGQNLKRLLKKRGWGRRPFPTEAMALLSPESTEAETFPRKALLETQRASTDVASLVSWKVARAFVETQTSWFSPINSVNDVSIFLYCYIVFKPYQYFYFLRFYCWYFQNTGTNSVWLSS
jgi:DDE family transposase